MVNLSKGTVTTMLKKILACLLLISVLAIGFCACGDEKDPAAESSDVVSGENTTESSDGTSGGDETQTPSGGDETQTPSGGDETQTPSGGDSSASTQKPNDIFDPSEGEDSLVGDDNWTGNY